MIKKDDFLKDPNLIYQYLGQLDDHDINGRQDYQLPLRVDESVRPAMFRPDPLIPGGYIANSLTLRAVRKDIFVAGAIDQLAEEVPCLGCHQRLDRLFWKLCPYCAREVVSL